MIKAVIMREIEEGTLSVHDDTVVCQEDGLSEVNAATPDKR